MKMAYVLVALLLVPSSPSEAAHHVRTMSHGNRVHVATEAAVADRLQGYGINGREIAAPPWSFACMNDQGPRQCGEPMWAYGSPGYLAKFDDAFSR